MLTMAIKNGNVRWGEKCSVKMLSKNKKSEFVINDAAAAIATVAVVAFCFSLFCILNLWHWQAEHSKIGWLDGQLSIMRLIDGN